MTSCGVTKADFLLRKGTIFWNKRYIVIKQDEGRLYYYNNDLDPAPKFIVELADGIRIREEPGAKKNMYCFTIFTANSQITFAATSSAEQESWMSSLVDAGIDIMEESVDGFIQTSIYDFTCKGIHGESIPLADFKGQVSLIVNVASK